MSPVFKCMKNYAVFLFFSIAMSLLSGCNQGGGSDDGDAAQKENYVTVYSKDSSDVTKRKEGGKYYVNLTSKVDKSNDVGINISDIKVLTTDPDCQTLQSDATGFSVSANENKVCDYEYSVASSEPATQLVGKMGGISRVIISEQPNESELTPFGLIAYQNQVLNIDLGAELKMVGDPTDLNGYTIDTALLWSGSNAQLEVDNENKIIKYTPASDYTGPDTILYSLKDADGNLLAGSIFITAVVEAKPGIDIQDSINITEGVNVSESTTIDLAPYVTNSDDDWQIIYVNTFNASVSLTDADNLQNKSFDFKADYAGDYYVNVVVTDHSGGFDIALVRIVVNDPSAQASWNDILQGLDLFKAPLTLSESESAGMPASASNSDSVGAEVAEYNYVNASHLCQAVGRLPTAEELTSLFTLSNPFQRGWPIDRPYWTSDTNTVVNLSTGIPQSSGTEYYYVTCLAEGGLEIMTDESSLGPIVANGSAQAKVVAQLTLNGQPVVGETLTAAINTESQAQMEASSAVTDPQGKAEFLMSDLKSEHVDISISYNDVVRKTQVEFVGDPDTAVLSMSIVKNNQALSGGVNEVQSVLMDANANPVSGQAILFTTDNASTTLSPSATINTNASGTSVADITYHAAGEQTNQLVAVTSQFREQVENADVTFTAGQITSFTQLGIDSSNRATIQAIVSTNDNAPVPNATVSFHVISGNCTLSSAEAVTQEQGQADLLVTQGGTEQSCEVGADYNQSAANLVVNWNPYVQIKTDVAMYSKDVPSACSQRGYKKLSDIDGLDDWIAAHGTPPNWETELKSSCLVSSKFSTFGLTGSIHYTLNAGNCFANVPYTYFYRSPDGLTYPATDDKAYSHLAICERIK